MPFNKYIMIFFNRLINLIFCCLWTAQAGSSSCYQVFSNLKSVAKGNYAPKRYSKQISNPEELAEFMTKNGELKHTQGSLFEIYMNNFFGDFLRFGKKNPLKSVTDITQKYPNELYKPLVREQEITFFIKEKDRPVQLEQFIKSFRGSAARIRNNLFQISANWGYWSKLLLFEFGSVSDKKEKKALFFKYLDEGPLDKKTREFIESSSGDYRKKTLVLYKALNKYRKDLANKGDVRGISKAMVELVHAVGFGRREWVEMLKSPVPEENLKAVQSILSERDLTAVELGFEGHFQELEKSLLGEKSDLIRANLLIKELKEIREKIETQPFKKLGVKLRLRPLSLQESPFRGCLGADCSTESYFDKAFEPHFLYFTLTDSQYQSQGHITVVLGKASNSKEETIKTAFVDKVQNVPNDRIIPMLEGIRRSLKEQGYVLGLAEDMGYDNGLSNDYMTKNFFETEILPNLKNKLKDFKPMESKHQFKNSFSRENESLLLREFEEAAASDSFEIRPGKIHEPKRLKEKLTVNKLYETTLALKDSKNEEDRLKYLNILPFLMWVEELGLSEEYAQNYLKSLVPNLKESFKLRKRAFFALAQFQVEKIEHVDLGFLEYWLSKFSEREQKAVIGEMSNWKSMKEGYKREFIEFLSEKILFYYDTNKLRAVFESPIKIILDLDLQFRDQQDGTALHQAVEKRQGDRVKLLVENGINMNIRDNLGRTALHWAVSQGEEDMVRLFLDRGADPDVKNDSGTTALHQAVQNKKKNMIKILLDGGANPNISNNFGRMALHQVVAQEEEGLVRLFLDRGADPNVRDKNGMTALHWAVFRGQENMAKLLLKYGADLHIKELYGKTVLHVAVSQGKEDMVKLLLEYEADPNISGFFGRTALHLAQGKESITRLLLEGGADPHIRDQYGELALQ